MDRRNITLGSFNYGCYGLFGSHSLIYVNTEVPQLFSGCVGIFGGGRIVQIVLFNLQKLVEEMN